MFKNAPDDFIAQDIHAIKGSLFVDSFLMIGIIIAIILIKKRGMLNMQIKGFYGMAIGMLVLMSSEYLKTPSLYYSAIFLGFIIFYLSLNAGPNPMTFLIPSKIYPTELRATGHGFAAAFAKTGATLGIVILPWMKYNMGVANMALFMAIICIVSAVITQLFAHLIIVDKELKKYHNILDGVYSHKELSSQKTSHPVK